MQSFLRFAAAVVLFSLLMTIPMALCILLDTRMNTPPQAPLPEPPVFTAMNPAPRVVFCPFDLTSVGDDEIEFVDGPRTVRLRVIHVKCDCPICREYRDKYRDWEASSHYYMTHKNVLRP